MQDKDKIALIKKHLGANTPDFVIDNCMGLLFEFEAGRQYVVVEPDAHICRFSKAMTQEYPRKCVNCGEPERVRDAEASAKLEKVLELYGKEGDLKKVLGILAKEADDAKS